MSAVILDATPMLKRPHLELIWPLAPLAIGSYSVAMVDPPWTFKAYSQKGLEKSPQAHYDVMSLDDIKAMPIAELAHRDGMWVWLWATAPMYDLARSCFDAWGVAFSTQGVWIKTTKDNKGLAFGTGHVLRNCHEPFLLGRIGKPKVHSKSIRSTIMAPRRAHSQKPDQAYAHAETLFGDVRRADVFSRQTRPGWDCWGHEAGKFDPIEPTLPGIIAA